MKCKPNVSELFWGCVQRFPNKTAVVTPDASVTYHELSLLVDDVCASLPAEQHGSGDIIAIIGEAGIDYLAAFLGILKAGCTAAPLKHNLTYSAMEECLRSIGAKAAFSETPLDYCVTLSKRSGRTDPRSTKDHSSDSGVVFYTSGTTGAPKSAYYPIEKVSRFQSLITGFLKVSNNDVILNCSRLASDFGCHNMLTALSNGATAVWYFSVDDQPLLLPELVDAYGITGLHLYPSMVFGYPDGWQATQPDRLRYFSYSGHALPAKYAHRLWEAYPKLEIYANYGSVEATRIASGLVPRGTDTSDYVGKPLPGVKTKLLSNDGRFDARRGELIVAQPHAMDGYLNSPEGSEAVFWTDQESGELYYRSGDIFERADDESLYYQCRASHMLTANGRQFSPRQMENSLMCLSGIAECAIARDGIDSIRAYYVLEASHIKQQDSVEQACDLFLKGAGIELELERRDRLPRSYGGKLATDPSYYV